MNSHVVNYIFWTFPGHFRSSSFWPPQGILVSRLFFIVLIVCSFVLGIVHPVTTIKTSSRASAEIRRAEVSVFAGFKSRCGRGWSSCVSAKLDVRLRGFDIINHCAELMDETNQCHIYVLAYGLARNCKITVKSIIVAFIQVMKRKGVGGVMRCAYGFLHYNSTNTESF